MYKVAILDDSSEAVTELERHLKKYQKDENVFFDIHKFSQGFAFLDSFKNNYDLIFLDIDMPAINGLDVARKIRKIDENVIIIFVTNMAGCAINGYEVAASDFLVKPINHEQLVFCLNRCINSLKTTQIRKITIKTQHGYSAINEDKILYIEVRLHSLIFHIIDGEDLETYGSLKDLEKILNPNYFVRCNSCYLVNLNHVDTINGDNCLIKGQVLPISRSKKKEFINRFMENI